MSSNPSTPQDPNPNPQPTSPFLLLPPEIHTLIATHLPYPDLLSLTLTHPLFITHPQIRTNKSHRVDWLLSRAEESLPLPLKTRCRWSSDREFVSNPEVTTILRRRREHVECAEVWARGGGGAGCLLIEGRKCVGIRGAKYRYKKRGWIEGAMGSLGSLRRRRDEVRIRTLGGGVELLRSWWVGIGVVAVAFVLYFVMRGGESDGAIATSC